MRGNRYMLTLEMLKNAADSSNEEGMNTHFLIVPQKHFDNPEIKKIYERTFPGVELIRNEPLRVTGVRY